MRRILLIGAMLILLPISSLAEQIPARILPPGLPKLIDAGPQNVNLTRPMMRDTASVVRWAPPVMTTSPNGTGSPDLGARSIILSVEPTFTRHAVNFHDQWEPVFNRTQWRLSASVSPTASCRLTYEMLTGTSRSESITPADTLLIGSTKFEAKGTEPVKMEWKQEASHRVEMGLIGIFNPFMIGNSNSYANTGVNTGYLTPLVMIEQVHFSITATGEVDKGVVTATEDFRRAFWGVGAAWHDVSFGIATDIKCAFGDKYSRFGASLSWAVARQAGLRVGYEYESMRFPDMNVRRDGWFGGISVAF